MINKKNILSLKIIITTASFLLIASSCVSDETKKIITVGFDAKSLVKKQSETLNRLSPNINKEIILNEKKEIQQLRLLNPNSELEFLEALRIGPAQADNYHIDSSSDPSVINFILKPGENNVVKNLTLIFSTPKKADLISLRGTTEQKDFFRKTEKNIQVHFKPVSNSGTVIDSYTLKGYEKLMFRDSAQFEINVQLLY